MIGFTAAFSISLFLVWQVQSYALFMSTLWWWFLLKEFACCILSFFVKDAFAVAVFHLFFPTP